MSSPSTASRTAPAIMTSTSRNPAGSQRSCFAGLGAADAGSASARFLGRSSPADGGVRARGGEDCCGCVATVTRASGSDCGAPAAAGAVEASGRSSARCVLRLPSAACHPFSPRPKLFHWFGAFGGRSLDFAHALLLLCASFSCARSLAAVGGQREQHVVGVGRHQRRRADGAVGHGHRWIAKHVPLLRAA